MHVRNKFNHQNITKTKMVATESPKQEQQKVQPTLCMVLSDGVFNTARQHWNQRECSCKIFTKILWKIRLECSAVLLLSFSFSSVCVSHDSIFSLPDLNICEYIQYLHSLVCFYLYPWWFMMPYQFVLTHHIPNWNSLELNIINRP